MDIVRFRNGLGNQMFQYAFMVALESRGRNVFASLGFYDKHLDSMPFRLTDVFHKIKLKEISDQSFDKIDQKWKELKKNPARLSSFKDDPAKRFFWVEENPSKFEPDVFNTRDCVFVGNWQTEKYFEDCKAAIKERFVFSVSKELELFAPKCKGCISVHIRRGDYLNSPYKEQHAGICEKQYYEQAIQYMLSNTDSDHLMFFSDDIEWVKHNLNYENAVYCCRQDFDHYQDWYDMYLMTQCSHNIIANSSFSWWGAWLNNNDGKIIITPKKWSNVNEKPDINPPEWIKL